MRTALLLLLLMAGAAFAQVTSSVTTSGSCITNATDIIFSEQGGNIIAVIGLLTVIIACAYAVGSSLGNANYIVLAKDEAYHLGFSIIMLLFFSGILAFSCALMDMFYSQTFANLGTTHCYSEGTGAVGVSNCYLNSMNGDAKRISEEYIRQHIDQLLHSTFMVNMQWPLLNSYSVTAGAYKRIVSNQYDMILNSFLVPALMSIGMQKLILTFITENSVRWILPIAFLLRFFPPTRQMGNIFIALVLGIYVVVPFMYAFNLSMYDVTLNDCAPFAQSVCDDAVDGYNCGTTGDGTCSNPFSFWNVARLIPQAFFLPNLTIVVVVTFLGCVHKALRVIG